MLNIYSDVRSCLKDLPKNYFDLSKTMSNELCEKLETICEHHKSGFIYIGFLEPLLMLFPQEEARIRPVFRKFEIFMIVGDPCILPFSWKNGIRKLVIKKDYRNVVVSS
ncbi:hypothetical protein EB118_06905 [bacterium]|nr:hypothetical protein [bacterium]